MIEMCNLVHNSYDRITDKVMWLGYATTLNFNVDLFFQRKDQNNKDKIKENFHKEYIYKLSNNSLYRAKISRDFNYYFSIDYNTKDIKDRAIITVDNIYFFIFNLKKVMQWFIGENGINTIFKTKNGKIFIPTHPEPIKIDLAFNTYIEFEPAVDINNNGYETIGVKTFINSDGIYFFMNSNTLFSLYHMLSTCNMYTLAQNMLNYIGRPEYGTNSYNLNTGTGSKNINFFDRVGAKDENISP